METVSNLKRKTMRLLKTVSRLTLDGYFYMAESRHGDYLPSGAVNLAPPSLKPFESAKINEEKNDWIIEEDPTGLHAPAFDFNDVEKEFFVFDEKFYTSIPLADYSLAIVRALTRHSVHKIKTKTGDRFFTFRGMEAQNRLIYLKNNLIFISKETIDAYNILYNSSGLSTDQYNYLLFKTKFGIEQSIYCMKLSFDYLIQITCYFLFNHRKIDSLGKFLERRKNNADDTQKIVNKSFNRYGDKHYNYMETLNDLANCYKHSYLQAFADNLHGKGVPSVTTVNLKKDVITVSNCQYLQLIYAFNISMADSMNSIKDSLSEETRKYFENMENDSMGFI